jgi:anti-sigma regulatory factor (Ser/Thr protein kinase)
MTRLTLGYDRSELGRLADWLDVEERRIPVPEKIALAVRLCLEEAVTNLIDHTRADAGSDIVVDLEWQGDTLLAAVEDSGPPFDLRAVQVPVKPASLEAAVPGGWGIHLIRTFANDIRYETNAGRNRLTMMFVQAEAPEA